jgi:Matrixin
LKKTKVIVASLIALSTVLTAIPIVANATIYGDKRNGGGVFNAWYDVSVSQKGYTSQLDWARSQWSGISSKVSIGKTTTATISTDQYYIGDTIVAKRYGLATFYKNGSVADANTTSWDYTTVSIYDSNMVKDGKKNDTNMKCVATHEVGHSVGLAHTNVVNSTLRSQSIMTSAEDSFINWNNTTPSDYDKGELKNKWGN